MNYFENKVTELRKLITMSLSKEERKAVEKLLREVAKDQREFSARAVHYWYGDDETPSDEGLLDHILKCEIRDDPNWGALTAIDKNLQGLMDLGEDFVDEYNRRNE
jgi:fatty acid-binding protein DegV